MRGGLGGTAGEAVAGGTRERRLVAVSAERLGEDAAEGLIEPEALDCGASARRRTPARGSTLTPSSFMLARPPGRARPNAESPAPSSES